MAVMGLVMMPGMMTGQMLGGQPPVVAGCYQVMIMYLVCAAASTAVPHDPGVVRVGVDGQRHAIDTCRDGRSPARAGTARWHALRRGARGRRRSAATSSCRSFCFCGTRRYEASRPSPW